MENSKTTLTEIARIFGVSTVTVSNALNKRKNVSPDKAEAICRYARKIGYQPSLLAKSLLKGRTNIIGFILKCSPEDPWSSAILNRLQNELWKRGYHLSMFVASEGVERLVDGVSFLASLNVDALIIGPLGFLDEYQTIHEYSRRFPYVMAFDAVEYLPIDSVKPDTYLAAKIAMEHFVACGHSRIGMLGYEQKERQLRDLKTRYSGFIDSLNTFGLELHEEWIQANIKGVQLDEESLTELIEHHNLPTAFFCHNDHIAAQAIRFFSEKGFRIPEDISLIGVNNSPIASLIHPGITSVSFNIDHYVDGMIQLLINHLQEDSDKTETAREIVRRIEAPELICRDSVKQINTVI